jgi:siroheme synthase
LPSRAPCLQRVPQPIGVRRVNTTTLVLTGTADTAQPIPTEEFVRNGDGLSVYAQADRARQKSQSMGRVEQSTQPPYLPVRRQSMCRFKNWRKAELTAITFEHKAK